jgi:hypothetical protein
VLAQLFFVQIDYLCVQLSVPFTGSQDKASKEFGKLSVVDEVEELRRDGALAVTVDSVLFRVSPHGGDDVAKKVFGLTVIVSLGALGHWLVLGGRAVVGVAHFFSLFFFLSLFSFFVFFLSSA